jgi:hypothetical protein
MARAPMHLRIAYMLARHLGYRSQSTVAFEWSNYQTDPRFGMCFRMSHKKNSEMHWIPASPELQAFLASIKVRSAKGPIAVRYNGQPWKNSEQLQKQSSNFLAKLASKGRSWSHRARLACHLRRRDQAHHRRERQSDRGRAWRPRHPHGRALYTARRAGSSYHRGVLHQATENENGTGFV